jgi:hypothetical protein
MTRRGPGVQRPPELASGRILGGFGLTEPEAGTDTAALACSAVRHGPGRRLEAAHHGGRSPRHGWVGSPEAASRPARRFA